MRVLERESAGSYIHKIDVDTNQISGSTLLDEVVVHVLFDGSHLWISTGNNVLKKLI